MSSTGEMALEAGAVGVWGAFMAVAGRRIEVVTEGILTRMLQSDPALEGIGCVIFDEFHERSLDADLALACAEGRTCKERHRAGAASVKGRLSRFAWAIVGGGLGVAGLLWERACPR